MMKKRQYQAKLSFYQGEDDIKEFPDFTTNLKGSPGWTVIEDSFTHFFVSNMAVIADNKTICPYSDPKDGKFELQFIRASQGRGKLLKAMTTGLSNPSSVFDLENKKPKANSGIECYRVKAFRLEPIENDGFFSVDGEVKSSINFRGLK